MKKALQSKWSLDARALALASIPTLFIIPAAESSGDLDKFWGIGFANLVSLTVALMFIEGFSRTNWVRRHWLQVLAAAAIAGSAKGLTLWLVVDFYNFEQPTLESRLLIATLSWILFVIVMAMIQNSLGEIRTSQQEVRQLLAQAQQEFDSLESQRRWLVQAKVSGLEAKLAKDFVQLLESLNTVGKGPGAFKDIAQKLRVAARKNVRQESGKAWKSRSTPWQELSLLALKTRPNSGLVLSVFLLSAGISTVRISGLSEFLMVTLGSGLVLGLMLRFMPGTYSHLGTPLVVTAADFLLQALFVENVSFALSLASGVWALTLILTASALELARIRIEEDKRAAAEALTTTQADIEWLSIQLEATNLELAKYLHSILQTRLMSHALLLEQSQSGRDSSVQELVDILTKPMSGFGSNAGSLSQGLDEIAKEWSAIVEVEIDNQAKEIQAATSATLHLVREAIANSVHHGMADRVWVKLFDSESSRFIEVLDNGIGPTQNPAGMGTQIYEDLCSNWSLTQSEQAGAQLVLTLRLA